jgi:ribosomal protein L11 methyltransferase
MVGRQSAEPDRAIRVVVPEAEAELVGAILMDRLGPYAQEALPGVASAADGPTVVLTFYPETAGQPPVTVDEVVALLPSHVSGAAGTLVEAEEVARDWEEGWKDHFHPILIDGVRIRPPWEPPAAGEGLIDVVINPGMGFGTGLHPTTRGTLNLLQAGAESAPGSEPAESAPAGGGLAGATPGRRGRLVDAGTGSGVLSIAAAKLGWGPIVAFDNDPVALVAAAENLEVNGVDALVRLVETDVAGADIAWFDGVTVLANMTLDPVSSLLRKLGAGQGSPGAGGWRGPVRLVVSGILAGDQESELLQLAQTCGFVPGRRVYETEWVSLELLPVTGEK